MTVNLNRPAIDPGPLSLVELEDARRNNPGSIWQISPHRMLPGRDTCNGSCQSASGCDCHSAYCAPEGGKHAEPVPSAQKKRDVNGARIGFVLLLLSASTVVGVISAAVLARWPLAWPLG